LNLFQSKRFPSLSLSSFENSKQNLTSEQIQTLKTYESQKYTIKDFPSLYSLLKLDRFSIYCGLIGFRKLTSDIDNFSFFSSLEASEFIAPLIKLAANQKDLYAQFESLWILSNLASGEGTIIDQLTENGIVLVLVQIIDHENEEIKMQGLWGLANIISEKPELRDCLLNVGIIDKLLKILKFCGRNCKGVVIWLLSNIYKSKPWVEWELFLKTFDELVQIVKEEKGKSEILENSISLIYIYSSIKQKFSGLILLTGQRFIIMKWSI